MARADGPALRRAAAHLGALAVTGALLWRLRATGWALPLLVAHGYVLAFVFCAFHETAHRTAFRTRWLNTALGTLAGLLIVWPYRNYRVYHWEHHRFTQDEARDPELYFAKPASVGAYLLVLTGVPNLIRRVSDLLRLAGGRADRPWMAAPERRPLIREARALPGGLPRGRRGLRADRLADRCCSSGSRRCWSARHSSARISWPSTPRADPPATAWRTRAPPAPWPSCVSSRGTCRITPSTTPTRRCPSTRCRACTGTSGPGWPTSSPATSRPPSR